MKKLLFLFIGIAFISCDDGDIIVENLDFDNAAVQACDIPDDGSISDYLFYIIDDADMETISLQINTTQNITTETNVHGPFSIPSNALEYRQLNGTAGSNYYCNDVPPSSPTTTQVYTGDAGEVTINTIIEDIDNDGISSEDEGINLTDLSMSQDTDGDGIPDYKDIDDDGDNVLTANEGIDLNDLSNSQDSDMDGTPDYLDNDDDGDGILTIQEDINQDGNPRNDIIGSLANYLNATAVEAANPPIDEYMEHNFTRTATLDIEITDLTVNNGDREIIFSFYDFGTYVKTITITETPTF